MDFLDILERKLLNDGQSLFPPGVELSGAAVMLMAALVFTNMAFWAPHGFAFAYYAILSVAAFFWFLTAYAISAWFAARTNNLVVEGPLFRSSAPPLRRWAFYFAISVYIAKILLTTDARAALFASPMLAMPALMASAACSAIIIMEMLRVAFHKRAWSDRWHLAAAIALTALTFIIKSVALMRMGGPSIF